MRADGDVRPSAPEQQGAVVGRKGLDRQLHNLSDRAGAVMVVGRGMDFTGVASARCVPRPRRVGIDHAEAFAGCGERGQIGDRAAVLDDRGVTLLCSLMSAAFRKRCVIEL